MILIYQETAWQYAYVIQIYQHSRLSSRICYQVPRYTILLQYIPDIIRIIVQANQKNIQLIFRIFHRYLIQI